MLALRLTPTRCIVRYVQVPPKVTYTMNQDLASVQSSFFNPIASIGNGRSKWIIPIVPNSENIQPEPISCVVELKAW